MSPLVESVTENYPVARWSKDVAVWKKCQRKVGIFEGSQSICRAFVEWITVQMACVFDKEHKIKVVPNRAFGAPPFVHRKH